MKNIRFFLFLFVLLVSSYCHAQTNPSLIWATYFGGNGEDYTFNTATDASGNVYISGYTTSDSGVATSGAYQTSNNGAYKDVFLAKFDSVGKLLWSTYYGGNSNDFGDGLTIDRFGNIYITGETYSDSGIATSGAFETSLVDSVDGSGFLAKFSSSGALLWGTYFAGNSLGGSSLTTDSNGDVYITGVTLSDSGIATLGSYQTSYAGGTNYGNPFLAKFTSNGVLLWGTYYGGSGDGVGISIIADKLNNIYISGWTASNSGIATSGAYQTIGDSINGDGFLAKFSSSGTLLWGTYFGGNYGAGLGSLTIDDSGNIYAGGATYSTSGIATSGAYQTVGDSTLGNAVLAKFSNSGKLDWATYYGGKNKFDACYGITVDKFNTVFITGQTQSTSGIATSGAFQSTGDSINGATFLAEFSAQGNLLWGSYFGGKNGSGSSLTTDIFGNLYLTGYSNSYSGIATPGAYQMFGDSINGDAFLAKFNINKPNNDVGISSIQSPASKFCPGIEAIKVQLKNYDIDTLKTVKINWRINGTTQTTYNWSGILKADSTLIVNLGNFNFTTGIDTIIAWTSSPNGLTDFVPGNDTTITIITVYHLPSTPTITLSGDTLTSSAKTGNQWYKDSVLIKGAINQKYVATSNGNYSVMVTDSNGCSATSKPVNYTTTGIEEASDNLKLNIYPNPFTNQTTISVDLDWNSSVNLTIYDMTGRVVVEKSVECGAGERFEYTFDADRYGCGIYIVKLTMGNEVVTREIARIRLGRPAVAHRHFPPLPSR